MNGLMPFFTFFGGKWRAAPLYPAPIHDRIIEPFAGSAGYAVRHHDHKVILIEKDPVIAALWAWLIRVSSAEIRSLPLIIEDVRHLSIIPEARSLIGFWLNKGMTAPCNIPSKWMREGWRPKSVWGAEIRDRIACQVEKIRHWRVFSASYTDVPNGPATWFVDPPYEKSGVRYRVSSTLIDFKHLAAWCQERQGQVIVCEQDGAEWLPFKPFRTIKALEGKKGVKRSSEVIWTNEEIDHGEED